MNAEKLTIQIHQRSVRHSQSWGGLKPLQTIFSDVLESLSYLVREDPNVPTPCPPLLTTQPFWDEHRLVKDDLINCTSHNNGLFWDNNVSVYFKLEEATWGTLYVNSINPYQRSKGGRGAFQSLLHQYCGEDKWDTKLRSVNLTLQTLKWRGHSNYLLERFFQKHQNGYTTMRAAVGHVNFQLPNEHTWVGYLINAIECNDAKLQAAIANIKNNKAGKRVDFEAAVMFLLPTCLVTQKLQKTYKRGVSEISLTTTKGSSFGSKSGIGERGVQFRYYKPNEYKKLTLEQIDKLKRWRSSLEGKAAIAKSKAEYEEKKRNSGKGTGVQIGL